MRDLKKILDYCATEDTMDYCPEFDGVKAILEYSDKNVKPFKKLGFRSGNDFVMNDLVGRLQEYFVERGLFDPDSKKPLPEANTVLRKILIFFLVNTDATYKHNLHDDTHIAHIYEICPLMPKFLTSALIFDLELDYLFYEALAYTPIWFAVQFFEAANESLKFINDAKRVLAILEELLKALLTNIERTMFLEMDQLDQKIVFNKMHDQAIILLRRFNTPDAGKIDKMDKSELEIFWGYTLKHLLQMVMFAFDLYESKLNTEPTNFDVSIYKIGQSFQKMVWTRKKASQAILDEQLKIIFALLGTLQNCVMNVSVSSVIEWLEENITPNVTLQQAVGELAFHVRERIMGNPSFEHAVSANLHTIEIRPVSFEEVVSKTNMGDILRALDDADSLPYEKAKTWFDELLNRGTMALENDECLGTINEHIHLMTLPNCIQIMEYIKLKQIAASSEADDESYDENVETVALLLKAVKQLETKDLLLLMENRFKLFGEDSQALSQDAQLYEQRVIEFLNKHTTTFDLHEFLVLCIENPYQLWLHFFTSACEVKEQIYNFCDTLKKMLPNSFTFVDKIFKEAILKPHKPTYFAKVFAELYFLLYREKKKEFLATFLNGHIKETLDEEAYGLLLPVLDALTMIATYDSNPNFDEFTAPMLIVIAHLIEKARWGLSTYQIERVQLVTKGIRFIAETLERFLPVVTEKDRKWLTSRVKSTCKPLTQFYFQKIMQANEDSKSLQDFLFSNKDSEDKTFVKFLKKTIVQCNAEEFAELLKSDRSKKHISTALLEIANEVQNMSNDNADQNYQYCLTNYLNFINCALENGDRDWKVLGIVLRLIAASPGAYYDQIFMEAISLLKQLLQFCIAKTNEPKELQEVKSFIEKEMVNCAAKDILLSLNEFNSSEN